MRTVDTREGGGGGGGKHKRETPAPTHVQSLVSRALVLCTVLARSRETLRVVLCVEQVRLLPCVLVSFCVTGETVCGSQAFALPHTREQTDYA